MKNFLMILICSLLYSPQIFSQKSIKVDDIKVRMLFNNKEVIIKLYNNSATQELIKLLPLELKFQDYANKEKITYLPAKLSLDNAPTGAIATAGEVTIYAPWGNLAIFYKDHSQSQDSSLIPIGKIEAGLKLLISIKNDFTAKLELIK